MDFGKRLRELRTEKALRQEDLGKLFHIGKSAVSQWESGTRTPDPKTLQKLADYFNCSIDYLLGRSNIRELPIDPKLSKPDEYEQFFLRTEKLSDEGKEKIWSFLKFVEQEEAARRARKEEKNKK